MTAGWIAGPDAPTALAARETALAGRLRYTLVFRLYCPGGYTLDEQPSSWTSMRHYTHRPYSEDYRTLNEFVDDWIRASTLPSNRALRHVEVMEGGMIDEADERELRFTPNYIIANTITASPRRGEWTLPHLVDLRNAFITVMNQRLEAERPGQGFNTRGWLHVE